MKYIFEIRRNWYGFWDHAEKARQQAAEGMADTDRMNAEIAEEEKAIDTLCREPDRIGLQRRRRLPEHGGR